MTLFRAKNWWATTKSLRNANTFKNHWPRQKTTWGILWYFLQQQTFFIQIMLHCHWICSIEHKSEMYQYLGGIGVFDWVISCCLSLTSQQQGSKKVTLSKLWRWLPLRLLKQHSQVIIHSDNTISAKHLKEPRGFFTVTLSHHLHGEQSPQTSQFLIPYL